ncbi:hypothetical protein BDV19DRAFT_398931 [Aspergillus venezuelensis]
MFAPSLLTGTRSLRKPIRRRNRLIKSCLECRRRKLKCDRMVSKTGSLKFRTHAPGAVPLPRYASMSLSLASPDGSEGTSRGENDEYLEPTPLAVQDAAYAADLDNVIDDIGIKVGMLRVGERIGGFYRPKMDEEDSPDGSCDQGFGATLSSTSRRSSKSSRLFRPSLPSVGLVIGSVPAATGGQPPLTSFLAPRTTCDKLLRQYWAAVHPVARILHRPTFALQYESLWELMENAKDDSDQIPAFLVAIVCVVLLSAVISMDSGQVVQEIGWDRSQLIARLQMGTENALRHAQLMSSTRLETLQAFVAYMLATCLDEVSRAHSALVGMAVRLAECVGLHRDPTEYEGFSAAQCQVRRLIWYQICFLDLRTSEIQGPRPFILRDGYTTRLPMEVQPAVTTWHEMVFSTIRFECQEMHRKCLELRNEVDAKRVGLTGVISKVEVFNTMMYQKYRVALGERDHSDKGDCQQPIQRMASLVLKMMVSQIYIYLLHRYMSGVAYRMPDRTRQLALRKGTEYLEAAVELDTAPDLRQWAWYNRSYHQYHIAFLLLYEVLMFPTRKQADRIWRCLDIIFAEPLANANLPPVSSNLANPDTTDSPFPGIIQQRKIKGRYLLALIRHELHTYRVSKGLKMPSSFEDLMITSLGPSMRNNNVIHGNSSPDTGTDSPHTASSTLTETRTTPDTETSALSQTLATECLDEVLELLPPPPGDKESKGDGTWSGEPSGLMDAEMLEIDWDLWDSLFPPAVNDGVLDMEGIE